MGRVLRAAKKAGQKAAAHGKDFAGRSAEEAGAEVLIEGVRNVAKGKKKQESKTNEDENGGGLWDAVDGVFAYLGEKAQEEREMARNRLEHWLSVLRRVTIAEEIRETPDLAMRRILDAQRRWDEDPDRYEDDLGDALGTLCGIVTTRSQWTQDVQRLASMNAEDFDAFIDGVLRDKRGRLLGSVKRVLDFAEDKAEEWLAEVGDALVANARAIPETVDEAAGAALPAIRRLRGLVRGERR